MHTSADKRNLTVSKVAEMLGVSDRTLRLWIQEGRVRPDIRTLGGHSRFLRATADKLVRRGAASLSWRIAARAA